MQGFYRVGATLVASVDAIGDPEPTLEYQWQRREFKGAAWSDISGATTDTYIPVEADLGYLVRVQATATNTAGSDTAFSLENEIRAAMTIQAADPVVSGFSSGSSAREATTRALLFHP